MLRTYIYVPDELDKKVIKIAKAIKISKAEAIRRAISSWVDNVVNKNSGAESLLMLAELGKKMKLKGPKDLSTNMDKYLWDNYEV